MKKSQILSIVFVGFLILSIQAQQDSSAVKIPLLTLDLDHLDIPVDSSRYKMLSTGRISKSLDDLPLQVYIITEEEILRNQYTTLSDVLMGLPGIQVSRPGTGELGESFQIWNLTGNLYTKILINGMPVKPSVVAGMPIGSQLPIRQAEKIEVIYGNSSAVYGADAVSGVINIVTKEADRGTFVRGDISLGKNGHNYINFSVGGKGGKNDNILKYNFYGSKYELNEMNLDYTLTGILNPLNYFETKGEPVLLGDENISASEIDENLLETNGVLEEDFIIQNYGSQYEGTLTQPEIQGISSGAHMLGVQLNYKGFGVSYNYMYRRTHSSLGLSPVYYKYNNPQNFWGESIQQFSLQYNKVFRKFTSSTQLNNLAYSMDNNSSLGLTQFALTDKVYRYSASNDLELSQVFSSTLFKNAEMVTGLSLSQSGNFPTTNYLLTPFDKSLYSPYATQIDSSYSGMLGRFGINPIVFSNLSGFFQVYYTWSKFRFLGGVRHDINSLYGNRTSPQLAILHKTSRKTSLRLSLGTAYKAPPTSLAYQSLAYVTDSLVNLVAYPNTNLKSEKFSTAEFGFTVNFTPRISMEQTFFYYRITNHIIPQKLPVSSLGLNFDKGIIVNDSVGVWINFAESVSSVAGSQTTLRFNNIIRAIRLNVEANLYFQGRQDELPNVLNIVEDYITLAPRHTGKLKVSMQPNDKIYFYLESHWMSKWLRILIPFEDLYDGIFGEADGYYALNAAVSFNISEELNLYVKASNFFDEKYGVVNTNLLEPGLVYNPQLGQTIRFGLTYKLN